MYISPPSAGTTNRAGSAVYFRVAGRITVCFGIRCSTGGNGSAGPTGGYWYQKATELTQSARSSKVPSVMSSTLPFSLKTLPRCSIATFSDVVNGTGSAMCQRYADTRSPGNTPSYTGTPA